VDAPRPEVLTDGELAEALRKAGLRLTRPRREVHAALRDLGGHRSADEVAEALAARGSSVSRTTVYNALEDLRRAGAVLHADAGPGRALFEARVAWHHHFVCRRCGAVIDVPCARGRRPCLDLPAAVGEADEAQVIFRGVCRKCGAP
jgi:Fur family ferric uptake transcriptional regulator